MCETSVITTTPTHRYKSLVSKLDNIKRPVYSLGPDLKYIFFFSSIFIHIGTLNLYMAMIVFLLRPMLKAPLAVGPLPIDRWLKLLASTQGRDKIYRLVQYFCRFLAYYLARLSPSSEYVKRIQRLSVTVGSARKRKQTLAPVLTNGAVVFRMGKPLDNLQIILRSNGIKADAERSMVIGKAIGFGGWLSLDMFQWFHGNGIVELSPEWLGFVNRNAPRLWLLGLLSSLSLNLYKIHRLNPDCLKSRGDAHEALCKGLDHQATRQVVKDALQDAVDLVIPLSLMGSIDVNPGVVGLAGTFTSCLGISSLLP